MLPNVFIKNFRRKYSLGWSLEDRKTFFWWRIVFRAQGIFLMKVSKGLFCWILAFDVWRWRHVCWYYRDDWNERHARLVNQWWWMLMSRKYGKPATDVICSNLSWITMTSHLAVMLTYISIVWQARDDQNFHHHRLLSLWWITLIASRWSSTCDEQCWRHSRLRMTRAIRRFF